VPLLAKAASLLRSAGPLRRPWISALAEIRAPLLAKAASLLRSAARCAGRGFQHWLKSGCRFWRKPPRCCAAPPAALAADFSTG